jgi:UrcA family protein
MNIKTTRNNARKIQLTLGMIGGCLFSAAMSQTAAAAQPESVPTVVVKYNAVSLTTEPGVRALYRRLEAAARSVCPADSNRDLTSTTVAKQCRETAVDRAVQQINNVHLAEMRAVAAKRG